MEIKRSQILVVSALLIFALAACVRPASRAPGLDVTATPAEAEFPLPGTDDVMAQLEGFATQTAIALQGGQPAPEVTAPAEVTPQEGTPQEGAPVVTEAPVVQETPVVTEAPAVEATPVVEVPTATNTFVPVPSATPGIPNTYTLRGGEFPYCIARRFNVDPGELLRINNLGPNTPTYAGLTLQIPQTGNPFPGDRSLRAHPTTYTVQSGDTIYSVACEFGDVDPDAIAFANNIQGAQLPAGETIQIP